MTDHNPFAAPEFSPVDLPEVSTDSEVNWPAFAGAAMGLNFVFWGLVLFVPATLIVAVKLEAALSIGVANGGVWLAVVLLAIYFGTTALPIIGGLVCFSAPVPGRAKMQLITSIVLQAVSWLWWLLDTISDGKVATGFEFAKLPASIALVAACSICFCLFLRHLASEIQRSDLATLARTISVSLTWLWSVFGGGLLAFQGLPDSTNDPTALLFTIWACMIFVWLVIYAHFVRTLRKAISEGAETSNRQK